MAQGRGKAKKKRKGKKRKGRTMAERHALGFSATTRAKALREAKEKAKA